jgi:hypothetical protein
MSDGDIDGDGNPSGEDFVAIFLSYLSRLLKKLGAQFRGDSLSF